VAHGAAQEASSDISELVFQLEKNAAKDLPFALKEISKNAKASVQEYVVKDKADSLNELVNAMPALHSKAKKTRDYSEIITNLRKIKSILDEAIAFEMPNFF